MHLYHSVRQALGYDMLLNAPVCGRLEVNKKANPTSNIPGADQSRPWEEGAEWEQGAKLVGGMRGGACYDEGAPCFF